MIEVLRGTEHDPQGLYVRLTGQYPIAQAFDFRLECASHVERELLLEHFRHHLGAFHETFRETFYNMGWRAAKSKKVPKRTHFARCATILDWEKKGG